MTTARQYTTERGERDLTSSGRQRAADGARHVSDIVPRGTRTDDTVGPIGPTIERWKRVLRSLQIRQDLDPACRWIRALAVQLGISAADRLGASPDESDELESLSHSLHKIFEDVEPKVDKSIRTTMEAWLELRWERDELERHLAAVAAGLRATYDARSGRCVREWFANQLPIPVLIGKPVPVVETEAHAHDVLAQTEGNLASATAACVPRPPRSAEQTLGEWHWNAEIVGSSKFSLEQKTVDARAEDARRVLSESPSAGPEPVLLSLDDVLRLHPAVSVAWRVAAIVGALGIPIVLAGFVMGPRATEDLRPVLLGTTAIWAVLLPTLLGKKVVDAWLRHRHAKWGARAAPRDAAYRAIAWQYLVRRAEVEQYEAEAEALRDFISASERLRAFDKDPDLGGQLADLRSRYPELAPYVDVAANDSPGRVRVGQGR